MTKVDVTSDHVIVANAARSGAAPGPLIGDSLDPDVVAAIRAWADLGAGPSLAPVVLELLPHLPSEGQMTKVDVRRIVDYEPLGDDKFVWRVAQAIGDAYREYKGDSVSMVASIEMARAAIKAIEDSSVGHDLPWGSF